MLRDKVCYLLKTHCSGKKIQLTLAIADYNLIFISEEGRRPRGQTAFLYHMDHSSGYRTCWYTALLVALAPPVLARSFLTPLLSPSK